MTEKIFIMGATGFIGSKLVHFLLKKNADITLYVRNVEKTRKLYPESENLSIVQGDYTTIDVFEREIVGHSRLFILIAAEDNMAEIKGTFSKIAYTAGVRQVVDISSGAINYPYRTSYSNAVHRESEDAILAVKGPNQFYVALRPYRFASNHIWIESHAIKNAQLLNTIHDFDFREDYISPTDIAELASVVLTESVEKHGNSVYSMISDTLTTNERAAIFSELLGKPIKPNKVPIKDMYELLINVGQPHVMAISLVQKMEAHDITPYYSILIGRPPQTLREWLLEDNNLAHFQ